MREVAAAPTGALVVFQLHGPANLSAIGGIKNHLVLDHFGRFPRVASQTRRVNTNSLATRHNDVRGKDRLGEKIFGFLNSHRNIANHTPVSSQLGVLHLPQLLPALALAPCRVLL